MRPDLVLVDPGTPTAGISPRQQPHRVEVALGAVCVAFGRSAQGRAKGTDLFEKGRGLGIEGNRLAPPTRTVGDEKCASRHLSHRVDGRERATSANHFETATRQGIRAIIGDVQVGEDAGTGAADEERAVVDSVVLGPCLGQSGDILDRFIEKKIERDRCREALDP